MPIFETVFQEKPAIVLEIGSVYTKIGFCGEAHPRFIISTEIRSISDILKKSYISLYDQTAAFFTKIFFKYLLASPKDRKVSIVESVLTPTVIRECIAKVLFYHFEVSSVLFLPTHLVATATLAVENAVVVDLGFKETIVIPVYSGVQVLSAWQAQPLGSEAVHDKIKAELILNGVKEEILTDAVIEDIKVRTCFVTKQSRALSFKSKEEIQPCPDLEYPVDGNDVIKVPGQLREVAFEVLFPKDNDRLGLPYIILDAILNCPVDTRKVLAENILLIGGTASALGMTARLKAELTKLIESDYYKNRLFIQEVKFHSAPSKPNFTAWLGGSIYSSTELITSSSFTVTRENYLKNSKIPDWVNYESAFVRTQG
ncbi:CLUMA_CG003779, isoform A [Clunio marinus]|uniref:CLUMA_CG003779, isoform A n=1 Tax=Clunio marinus TaxID=568069 RepID=A0A1J1HRP2_9DIPT|nr:CLUMA_CG003779, isoform A [Clunio marinus]